MSIFEYDEELHKKTLLEEGFEKGMEQGLELGRAEGKVEGKAESLLELLEELGDIPGRTRQRILEERDLLILKKWIRLAVKTSV